MNIWVPRTKLIEPEFVIPGAQVAGRFRITGQLDDGRQRVLQDWTPNLITDGGLERWGTEPPIVNCAVGGGSTPPTPLDSALVSFLRQQSSGGGGGGQYTFSVVSPYYAGRLWNFVFNPPGSNLAVAEIGVGWGTNGTNLWSRSLTKDIGGNPLVLNWLANETLTITYEARRYPWEADVPHTTDISGVTYTGVLRPSLLGNLSNAFINGGQHALTPGRDAGVHSGDIGLATATPGGLWAGMAHTYNAYVAGSLQATGIATIGPAGGNFAGGIKSAWFASSLGWWQVNFTPTIAKLNTHTLTFNVTSGKWGRKA